VPLALVFRTVPSGDSLPASPSQVLPHTAAMSERHSSRFIRPEEHPEYGPSRQIANNLAILPPPKRTNFDKVIWAWCAGCSKTHLPGYVSDYEKLQAAGADVIVCTSTDNGYALSAWADEHKAQGKVSHTSQCTPYISWQTSLELSTTEFSLMVTFTLGQSSLQMA
jgi:hypothetical protein